MIDRRCVFEIHKLRNEGFTRRSIARQLGVDPKTVTKYLADPDPVIGTRKPKPSKLDPYSDLIVEMLRECPDIKAPVVMQRIRARGFDGAITIVRDRLRTLRGRVKKKEVFIRFESKPGEQVQIDWGHFGNMSYGNSGRRLYALVVLEGYSRMLYVFFSHSQQQECLHQGLLQAFSYFNGVPREIVVDNMLTAVTERVGSIVRFNESFLDFLGKFSITPRACNVRAPHEKGKVENAIKYIRQNFWPLRKFTDLADLQRQTLNWLNTVANVRKHNTTGVPPVERLQGLRPLPEVVPDCRQVATLLVHKDFGVRFDGNVYSVPPWAVGKHIIVKADTCRISVYFKDKLVACHLRCWSKKQRIELETHREQVKKLRNKLLYDREVVVFLSLGDLALQYLEKLSTARLPVRKNIRELLRLQDEYGERSLLYALQKGLVKKLYRAEYIRNILLQETIPVRQHPPVQLKQEELNKIRITTPALAEYDSIAVKRRKRND
jgi:transposase